MASLAPVDTGGPHTAAPASALWTRPVCSELLWLQTHRPHHLYLVLFFVSVGSPWQASMHSCRPEVVRLFV